MAPPVLGVSLEGGERPEPCQSERLGRVIADMWKWADDATLRQCVSDASAAGCVQVPVLLNAELDRRGFEQDLQPLVQAAFRWDGDA